MPYSDHAHILTALACLFLLWSYRPCKILGKRDSESGHLGSNLDPSIRRELGKGTYLSYFNLPNERPGL